MLLLGDKNVLLWLMFVAIFAFCAFWHINENKRFMRQWQDNMDAAFAQWLRRFAWSRTWQLLTAMACGMVIIAAYDWQLSETRSTLTSEEVKIQSASVAKPAATAQAEPKPAFIQQPPVPTMAVTAKNIAIVGLTQNAAQVTPPAQPAQAVPAASPASTVPPADPGNIPDTVDTVYNPEKEGTDNQSAIDALKKRYEGIIVNYLFLKKCGKATASDYRIIMSALGQEMASVNAPGRLQYDLITAANGSYKEMYSRSSCQGDGFNVLYSQYTDYIKTLSEHFPPD